MNLLRTKKQNKKAFPPLFQCLPRHPIHPIHPMELGYVVRKYGTNQNVQNIPQIMYIRCGTTEEVHKKIWPAADISCVLSTDQNVCQRDSSLLHLILSPPPHVSSTSGPTILLCSPSPQFFFPLLWEPFLSVKRQPVGRSLPPHTGCCREDASSAAMAAAVCVCRCGRRTYAL